MKGISIQISPASVCFRVSLNSSDVQGEKARFVGQPDFTGKSYIFYEVVNSYEFVRPHLNKFI